MMIEFKDSEGRTLHVDVDHVLTVRDTSTGGCELKLTNGDSIVLSGIRDDVATDINRAQATMRNVPWHTANKG